LVVESPICCLTLKQNGINAIARLGNRNGDIDRISLNTEIYLVPDIDSHRAGEKEAIKLGALLRVRGYSKIKMLYLSDDYTFKTDVNSFFMKNDISKLRSLVKVSSPIEDHRIVEGISLAEEISKIENKKLKDTVEYDMGSDLSFAKYLEIIPEIKRYVDVVEFGSLYKCICPFHADTTPSLTIYPKSKSWFCFSCNIGGDIVEFVKRIEDVDFKEAVKIIVRRNKNEKENT
jgi:DNA primase